MSIVTNDKGSFGPLCQSCQRIPSVKKVLVGRGSTARWQWRCQSCADRRSKSFFGSRAEKLEATSTK